MNNEELNDVLRKSSDAPVEEAVTKEPQAETKEVIAEVQTDKIQEPSAPVETKEEITPVESIPQVNDNKAVDDLGVPWKNRAMEYERKSQQIIDTLPKVIEDALSKKEQDKEKEAEYTIEELEAFALQQPEHRAWVEGKKEKVRENKMEQKLLKIREEERASLEAQQVKNKAEQVVVSDPRYSDAFVVDAYGKRQWNSKSPLAQGIHAYMQDPRLANQPDAMLIAARLARADILDNVVPKSAEKLTTLKRENAQLKNKTLVEGGGVNVQTQATDSYVVAKQRAAKTGSKKDTQAAVLEYMKNRRK